MSPLPQVWRSAKGELFHGACFEEGESHDSYTEVKLQELEEDDECESCGGTFLSGLEPLDDDDEVDTEDEDK